MISRDDISQLWQQQPHIIRSFLELRPRYEKLSEEIAYILKKEFQVMGIEFADITFRAKTVDSFCEKIIRKHYEKPLQQITDFAGVRLVYLYLADRSKIEDIIEKEFIVVEKFDKIEKADPAHFGYGALHYLVKLGNTFSGARYDDLNDLVCEIQVRTILQDAWAMVAHHLTYKQESDVPKELRRKLNALSGLFETADDQFDRLKIERINYKNRVREEISLQKDESLNREIDLDNLTEFLSLRMPDREIDIPEAMAELLSELKEFEYTSLIQVENVLRKGLDAVKAYETKYPPSDEETGEECPFTQVGAVRVALTFTDTAYFKKRENGVTAARYPEFRSLVKE